MLTLQLYCFLIAFIGCFFSTISGGGAGFITLPLFLLVGMAYPNALAIHKFATTFIGLGALMRLKKENIIDRRLFWLTGLLPCPFVVVGTLLSERFPSALLRPVLGVFIVVCLYLSYRNRERQLLYAPKTLGAREVSLFWLILAFLGVYNGLIAAGTGVFVILLYVWLLGYDQLRANALMVTSAAFFWNGTSLLTHLYLGHLELNLTPAVFVASVGGSYLGTSLGIKKGNSFLFKMFMVSALITAALLFYKK